MKENQEIIITIGKMNVIGITEGITQKTYIPIVDLCKYLGINSNMQIKKIKSEYIFKDNIKTMLIQTNNGIKSKFCFNISIRDIINLQFSSVICVNCWAC